MDLYFAGAEQPVYMRQLVDLDVSHVAISFYEWRRRHSVDDIYKHVPAGVEVCITPGIAKKTDIDFKEFGDDYVEFCERNAEQCLVYDFDAPHCPPPVRADVRNRLSVLPNVVVFPYGDEVPSDLARDHERIGINASRAKSVPPNELRRIQATLYGSNVTDAKVLKGARFEATTSFAWLSARRYGELWVWVRGRLHHYAAEDLAKGVRAHREAIEALGGDPAAVLANESAALVGLAVKSLQAMAESLSRRPRDRQEPEIARTSPVPHGTKDLATRDPQGAASALEPVIERDRIPLPGILLNGQEGDQKIASTGVNQRRCNNCNLSEQCPEFHENATCAFELPVEIKTREQWEAASHYLLEMQMGRIAFAHFDEQINGQVLTPRLGQEMDRFYKLLTAHKDLEAKPDPIAGGVMSRLFPKPPEQLGESDGSQEDDEDEDDDIEEAELVIDGFANDEENASV